MKDSKLRLGAQKYCFGDQTLFAYNLLKQPVYPVNIHNELLFQFTTYNKLFNQL